MNPGTRGDLAVESLLKIVLVLVAVWLVFEIVAEVAGLFAWILGPLKPLVGLVVLLLIVLWLLDRL